MNEASKSTPRGIIAELLAEAGERTAEQVQAIERGKERLRRAERKARRERQRLAELEPAGIPLLSEEETGTPAHLLELRRKDREEKFAEQEVEVRAAEYQVREAVAVLQRLIGEPLSPAAMGIVVAPQRFPQ